MKNILTISVLLISFALTLGCDSKTEENKTEENKTEAALTSEQSEQMASKRALLIKASEEKAEERRLAAIEKAKLSPTYTDANGKIIYLKAEEAPFYTGGDKEMMKYLRDNLKYPEEAREEGIEGVVFVDFVIDEQGKVKQVKATDVIGEDLNDLLQKESVRVVSSMPGWNAGLQQNKAVNVSFSLPVKFQLVN